MAKMFRSFWLAFLRQKWPVCLIILSVFALGLAAGFSGVHKLQNDQTQELNLTLEHFLQQAGLLEIEASKAMKGIFYNNIFLVLAVYLLGLTVIGIPIMLAIIFMRGFALGFAIEFLTREKSVQGIILTLAAIFPQNAIMVPALLIAGMASLSFALLLAKRFNNSKISVWPGFVIYSGLMVLILVCFAGAGLVEVYLTPLLVKITVNYVL
ncbi:MAG: Stage II sporulation protein M [Pelotomaculum sp. PtaU1.Bin035]|nr:MAG: Stage II sporulation protein M [Pelotomaculum sp. PtaU1.Bin035]